MADMLDLTQMESAACQIAVILQRYAPEVGSACPMSSDLPLSAKANSERVAHASIRADESAIQQDYELV